MQSTLSRSLHTPSVHFYVESMSGAYKKGILKVEGKRRRAEDGGNGARAGLWLLLCRNVNTLQRWQKTMTPQGEAVCRSCVCEVCVGAATAPRGAQEGRAETRAKTERARADRGKIGDVRFRS